MDLYLEYNFMFFLFKNIFRLTERTKLIEGEW